MAKRATPLYEMMVRRSDAEAPGAPRVHEEPAAESGGKLVHGRMLRVPVGYALVALAVVVGLVIGSYIFGAVRGAKAKEAEYEGIVAAGVGEAASGRARDPLVDPPEVEMGGTAGGGGRAADVSRPGPGAARDAGEHGPLESDPRKSGLNYLVLVETQRSGAIRLAEFCREEGLAAYVIPGNNSRLRRVIVLPGFDARTTSDPAVQTVLRDVERVGRKWKSRYPGESDLRDAYLSR